MGVFKNVFIDIFSSYKQNNSKKLNEIVFEFKGYFFKCKSFFTLPGLNEIQSIHRFGLIRHFFVNSLIKCTLGENTSQIETILT